MTDPVTPTDPNAKGSKTTEGKLTFANTATGGAQILAGLGMVLGGVQTMLPWLSWVGAVVSALGTLQMVIVNIKMLAERTSLKETQVEAAAAAGQAAADRVTSNADAKRVFEGGPSP